MEAGNATAARNARWMTPAAFAVIYLVWGSTFLAIRVGVREVPPFLFAAMRFLAAGALLFGWMRARGERAPAGRQWGSILLVALLIFVFDYGLLFWAERRVPSGLAAVMMATIPGFMALAEIVFLRTQRMTARLAAALLVGIAGVAVLVTRPMDWPGLGALGLGTLDLGGKPIDGWGALALVIAAMSWAIASVLTKKLPLPASRVMSSGAQMLAGGGLLAVASAALGEFRGFHPGSVSLGAWLALLYLIVPGSIVGFTAYTWLIQHESPTRVGTYAYVNPVVAVAVGYLFGGEPLGLRAMLGTALVLVSVVAMVSPKTKAAQAKAAT